MIADLPPAALDRMAEESYQRHRAADLQQAFASAPEPRRRSRLPMLILAGALAGGVAASVVIVPQLVQDGGNAVTPPAASPSGARGFLLAAAETAARTPAGAGDYWYTRQRTFNRVYANEEPIRKRAIKADTKEEIKRLYEEAELDYVVYKTATAEQWRGRSAKLGSRSVHKDHTELTFGSAQDEAKWKAEGSPGLVDKEPLRSENDELISSVSLSNPALTLDDLDDLPTSADALEDRLRVMFKDYRKRMRGGIFDAYVWQTGIDLLAAPTPPKVRAAMFRVMAARPGVVSEGTGTDALGRTGTVLAVESPSADGGRNGAKSRLIIDPETAEMLQNDIVDGGMVVARVTLEDAGWVNERGERP
jgi:hypothetical protein